MDAKFVPLTIKDGEIVCAVCGKPIQIFLSIQTHFLGTTEDRAVEHIDCAKRWGITGKLKHFEPKKA